MNGEPVFLCGLGEKWGKQYRQGNRIYDSRYLSCALTANPVWNMGGQTYLYMVCKKVDNQHYGISCSTRLIGNFYGENYSGSYDGATYDVRYIAPTLCASGGANKYLVVRKECGKYEGT